MEQHLFTLLFLIGVTPLVLSVPRKYYLIQQGMTWSDAQTYCRASHTDLAMIQSNDNVVQLQKEIQRQQFSSTAWIGLWNDVHSWRWSLGNEPLGSIQLWVKGEQNNGDGNETCVGMYSGGWGDLPCTKLHPFVCFDGNETGNNMYVYISTSMTWYNAQSYCRTYYTDLASARNKTENSIISALNRGIIWIGLFRDAWKWIDNTTFSTISWMTGKPDNALGSENCGYLNNGQAVDALCSDIMPFFCYSVITGKQQIVKLKVQSNQDVNDPAAKVAILEQMKQKLKDHGMAENITVKWREQPDGKVFHKEKENNTTGKIEL